MESGSRKWFSVTAAPQGLVLLFGSLFMLKILPAGSYHLKSNRDRRLELFHSQTPSAHLGPEPANALDFFSDRYKVIVSEIFAGVVGIVRKQLGLRSGMLFLRSFMHRERKHPLD